MARPENTQRRAVTASAAVVDLSKPWGKRHAGAIQPWQDEAWTFYTLPEIRYPANYFGANLSRFIPRIGLTPEDDPNGIPVVPEGKDKSDTVRAAEDYLADIQGPQGGIGEIMRAYGVNMQMVGDGWLVGTDKPNQDVEWEFLSIKELVFSNNGPSSEVRAFRDYDGTGVNTSDVKNALPKRSTLLRRFWRPHPQYSLRADAALEALADDCKRLMALNDSITSRLISRLAQAGILFIPTSLSIAAPPGESRPDGRGQGARDQLIDNLFKYMQKAMTDRSGASGSIPIIVRGASEAGEKIRFITMDRTIDQIELNLRQETRLTIARGLDLPPEVQQGVGDANHWSAWSVMDSSVQSHELPAAERFGDGLLRVVIWPQLKKAGFADWRRVRIVMDSSQVIAKPNQAEDGRQLWDRSVISNKALRERSAVPEDDAPDDDEYVRRLGWKQNDPYLATWKLSVQEQIDWDKVGKGSAPGAPGIGSTPQDKRPADSSDEPTPPDEED